MVGHIVITFTDPDSANKAILNGLIICNKKVLVTKCKHELVRCLKCQGYNHIANKCIIWRDIWAECGRTHRTNDCSELTLLCTPCGTSRHMSSDQMCPMFLRKCTEHDMRNPENQLPFFPSTEAWTWESALPSGPKPAVMVGLADFMRPDRNSRMHQTQLPF